MASVYPEYHRWQQVLIKFLDLIQDVATAPELESLLRENHLLEHPVAEIYQDPHLQLEIISRMEFSIKALKMEYQDKWYKSLRDNFVQEIEEDDLSLTTRCQLLAHPSMIRMLEAKFYLPLTGDLSQLMQNYRAKYYTSQCLAYGVDPDICIAGAARVGNINMVRDLMHQPRVKNLRNPMENATQHGHCEIVKLLLPDRRVGSAIISYCMELAIRRGHFDMVKLFFSDARITYLDSAIFIAVSEGYRDIVALLLTDEERIDNLDDCVGEAMTEASFEMAELLMRHPQVTGLNYAVTMLCKNKERNLDQLKVIRRDERVTKLDRALYAAVKRKRHDMIEILLPDPRVKSLNKVARQVLKQELFDLLELVLADPRTTDLNKTLVLAVERGLKDLSQRLLSDSRVTQLDKVIWIAIEADNEPLAWSLLSDNRVENLDKALMVAIKAGKEELIKRLIQDPRITKLCSALLKAIAHKISLDTIKIFLTFPDITDFSVALAEAVRHNRLDVLKTLLSSPHDPRIGHICHALDVAVKRTNRLEATQILLADPRITDLEPTFKVAAHANNLEVIKLLIHDSRLPNIKNAVSTAIFYRHWPIIHYLLVEIDVLDINTVMEFAIQLASADLVQALLMRAIYRLRDLDIDRAMQQARVSGLRRIEEILDGYDED